MNQNYLIDYLLNMLLNQIQIKFILKKSYGFNIIINNIKKIENNNIKLEKINDTKNDNKKNTKKDTKRIWKVKYLIIKNG